MITFDSEGLEGPNRTFRGPRADWKRSIDKPMFDGFDGHLELINSSVETSLLELVLGEELRPERVGCNGLSDHEED